MTLETALILAGGRGTRLEEIGKVIPKGLVKLNGKPILERIIEWLKKNEVKKVYLGVGYKKEKIKEYFGNGEKLGLEINYVEHDPFGGTEDAFKSDIEQADIKEENFYAMNGDQITDVNLKELTKFHLEKNAIFTMMVTNLRTNYGLIGFDSENKLKFIQEKGKVPDVFMNSGIYIFNKKILRYLKGGNIEENGFREISKEGKAYTFLHKGEWISVNDRKELEKAENYFRNLEFEKSKI